MTVTMVAGGLTGQPRRDSEPSPLLGEGRSTHGEALNHAVRGGEGAAQA